MTTTKNKFRFGECFYKCSLPKKMRVYFLYLKKMLNNEICPDFLVFGKLYLPYWNDILPFTILPPKNKQK